MQLFHDDMVAMIEKYYKDKHKKDVVCEFVVVKKSALVICVTNRSDYKEYKSYQQSKLILTNEFLSNQTTIEKIVKKFKPKTHMLSEKEIKNIFKKAGYEEVHFEWFLDRFGYDEIRVLATATPTEELHI